MLDEIVRSQYHAALSMLQQTIEKCPHELWNRAGDQNRFWQVVYHALFYVHLYVQPSEEDFVPWQGHIAESANMEADWTQEGTISEALYLPQEMLDYLAFCRREVNRVVPDLDMDGESGFYWLPMSKAELQIYSIRHLQSHTGELAERLWTAAGIEVEWVGLGRENNQ